MIIAQYREEAQMLRKRLELLQLLDNLILAGYTHDKLFGSDHENQKEADQEFLEPFDERVEPYHDVFNPIDVNERLKEIHGKGYGTKKKMWRRPAKPS